MRQERVDYIVAFQVILINDFPILFKIRDY